MSDASEARCMSAARGIAHVPLLTNLADKVRPPHIRVDRYRRPERCLRKRRLSPVCLDGTWGAEFYGGISPGAGDIVIVKHRYSAYHGTNLNIVLRSRGVRTVVLTKVSTHVCVETTAREAFVRDYYTVVLGDCCGGRARNCTETHQSLLWRDHPAQRGLLVMALANTGL